jgi:hypothetical protein
MAVVTGAAGSQIVRAEITKNLDDALALPLSTFDVSKTLFFTFPRLFPGSYFFYRVPSDFLLIQVIRLSNHEDADTPRLALFWVGYDCRSDRFVLLEKQGDQFVSKRTSWASLDEIAVRCGLGRIPFQKFDRITKSFAELLRDDRFVLDSRVVQAFQSLAGAPDGVFFLYQSPFTPQGQLKVVQKSRVNNYFISVSPQGSFLLWDEGLIIKIFASFQELSDYLGFTQSLAQWEQSAAHAQEAMQRRAQLMASADGLEIQRPVAVAGAVFPEMIAELAQHAARQ